MTISSTTSQTLTPCNGTTTNFAFANKIFSASDLVATLIDPSGNLYPFLSSGVNTFTNALTGLSYTVFNIDIDAGCFIVFTAAPTNGWSLDMRTAIAELQSTSIKNQGSFYPELHEEFFDRATREIQDLRRLCYTYGIHGPDIETTAWPALPLPALRKGLSLVFDPVLGLPTCGVPTTQNVTQALIGQLLYPQTAAEIAAGAAGVPVSPQYPPYTVFRYMSAAQISDVLAGTLTQDVTTAFQNALTAGGVGSTIYAPFGKYRLNGTLSLFAGQTLKGDGWVTNINFFSLAGGTILVQFSSSTIPLLMINGGGGTFVSPGTNQSLQIENVQLRDLALINNTSPGGGGIGFWANMARKISMRNVYIASFANSVQWINTSWLCEMVHCTCIDFTAVGLTLENSTDDNLFQDNQFSGYYPQSVAVACNQEGSNNTFLTCYFQGCNFGVALNQQDNGAGAVYPMSARFVGCLMEDIVCAGFALNSTLNNPTGPAGFTGNKGHPALLIEGLRAYNSGNFTQAATVTSSSGTGSVATLGFAAVSAPYVIPVGSQIVVTGNGAYNTAGAVVTASGTTSVSYASTATGSVTGGTITSGAIANNGQSIVYAQFASQISVRDVSYAVGFSYAATFTGASIGSGTGYYGYFYNGSGAAPVGPVVWEQDNNAVWGASGANNGAARFRGTTGAISIIPGNTAIGSWTNAGTISYTSGNTTLIPFQTVVTDFGQWVSSVNSGCIVPLRKQLMRFSASMYTASAPIGTYNLWLYKNGSLLAILWRGTNSAAQPFNMQGTFFDTPNGTTDYYQVFINSSASFTMDNTAGNTWFVAEVAGV